MIRSLLLLFAFIVLFCEPLGAQNLVGTALRLKPSSLPLTCNIGDLRTDQLDSYKLKQCGVGNLWAEISGGGDALTLQGRDINAGAPAPDDVLTWNDSTSEWEPRAAQAPLPNFTSGRVLLGDGTNIPVTDSGLTFNTGTDALTATTFIGALTGNVTGNLTGDVTGNVSGTSGSTTGNAATATAFAANPSDCASDTYATTIAANGNLSCATVTSAGLAGSIDATKIADGSVTSTEFQYINTLSSNAQDQLNLKAPLASPTFTGTVTLPFSTAGPVITTSGGVLSSEAVLAIARGGTNKALTLSAGGVPYFDSDSFEVLNAGTAGFVLTSGGASAPAWAAPATGSGINLLSGSNPKAESGSELPWTETGGGTLTVTSTAANVANGTYAFSYDASANTDHADSPAITIPAGLFGQNCLMEFYYKGFDTNITFQVHDGTNVIASQAVAAAATNYTKQQMNFICPSSGTLQMRIYAAGNAAIGYWDEVHLGSATNVVSGSQDTPWTAWTPTGSWVSNTTYTGFKRRVGDSMQYRVKVATSGAPTSTPLTINMPSGEVIDTAKLATAEDSNTVIGQSSAYDTGVAYKGHTTYSSAATLVMPRWQNATAGTTSSITQAAPFTFGAGDWVDAEWTVPIVGFTATNAVQLTNQNWRVDANISGADPDLGTSAQSAYVGIENGSLTLSNATGDNILTSQIPCSSTNPSTGTTCAAGNESIGVAFTIPRAGAVRACAAFGLSQVTGASGKVRTTFQIIETSNTAQTVVQEGKDRLTTGTNIASVSIFTPVKICGTFVFSSAGLKTLRLMYEQSLTATLTAVNILANTEAANGQNDIHWEVYPIDQNGPALITGPRSMVWLTAGNGHGGTNTKIRRFSTTVQNTGSGITYADSAANGASFTINEQGVYCVDYMDYAGGGTVRYGVSVNSNQLTTNIQSITNAHRLFNTSTLNTFRGGAAGCALLSSGDVVRPHTDGAADETANESSMFRITQVSR